MDSSTEEKFSRHLLVKLQGHAFEGNGHAGDFVRRLMTSPKARSHTCFPEHVRILQGFSSCNSPVQILPMEVCSILLGAAAWGLHLLLAGL